MKIHLLTPLLLMLVSLAATAGECPPMPSGVDKAIDAHIARIRAAEYCDYRRVKTSSNITIVTYTAEGACEGMVGYAIDNNPGTCGLHWERYMVGLLAGRIVGPIQVGQKGGFGDSEINIVGSNIVLEGLSPGPKDAMCCPSLRTKKQFALSNSRFSEIKDGSETGAAKGTSVATPSAARGPRNGQTSPANSEEVVTLNIESPRDMPKDRLEIGTVQGHKVLLDVLRDERDKGSLDGSGNRFPQDTCYFGAITSAAAQTAGAIVNEGLNDLAVDITFASLGLVGTQSAGKDALYKFVLDVASASLKREDLSVVLARRVVERSLGYILPFVADKFENRPPEMLVASSEDLSKRVVRKFIREEGIVSGTSAGTNKDTRLARASLVPLTTSRIKWFYSPRTHYLSAFLSAQCEGAGTGLYLIRFRVKTFLTGRTPDLTTTEILSLGKGLGIR